MKRKFCPRCGTRLKYLPNSDEWVCEFCGMTKEQHEKDLQRWFSD